MGLIRVNIFLYVSCFSNALDNKDPEFPVALAVKDEVGCNGIFRHVDRLKIDRADQAGLITVSKKAVDI